MSISFDSATYSKTNLVFQNIDRTTILAILTPNIWLMRRSRCLKQTTRKIRYTAYVLSFDALIVSLKKAMPQGRPKLHN